MPTKIWGISDNRAGHLAQLQAVLQLLPENNKLFVLQNSSLGKLNFASFPLGVSKKSILEFKEELKKDIPQVLLVIGRRNLSLALYLKKIIKPLNPDIKLVFLMPPGTIKPKALDLVFMHRYKMQVGIAYPKNIIPLDFSPAKLALKPRLTAGKIMEKSKEEQNLNNAAPDITEELKIQLKLANVVLAKPYIGVIIGGAAKGVFWNIKVANILCDALKALAAKNSGSLLVSSSRRTGEKIAKFIKSQLPKGSFFWQFDPNASYNPYLDIVAISDVLIVTCESTSMVADCITLNSKAKVLLFDDPKLKAQRFKPFRDFLYNNNYATSLKNGDLNLETVLPQQKAQNSAYLVADFVKKLLT